MDLIGKKKSVIFISYIISYGLFIATVRVLLLKFNIGYSPVDYGVYRGVGDLLYHQEALYSNLVTGIFVSQGLPFVYTPFTAIFMSILSFIPEPCGIFLWTFINATALCFIVILGCRESGLRHTWIMLGIFTFFNVTIQHFIFGQINMILILMCLYDFLKTESRILPRGTLIGVAASIKLTPLLFVAFFICTRRWKEAKASIIAGSLTIAIGGFVLPRDSYQYFASKIFGLSSVVDLGENFATSGNSSIQGVAARLWGESETPWVTVISILISVGIFWLANKFCDKGDNLAACAILGIASCQLSPVSWLHHWIWIVPAITWLLAGTNIDKIFAVIWSALCIVQSTDLGDLLGQNTSLIFLPELLRSSMVLMSCFWLILMCTKNIKKPPQQLEQSVN